MKIQSNKRKKGFTLIELMVVIAILASLAAIGYGPIMDHMNDGDRQQANSNLGQLHKMLLAFKNDRSSYPSDSTADTLNEELLEKPDPPNYGELKGNYSNDYFRQLFIEGKATDETPFYAKVTGMKKEPDNKIFNGEALQKGENAYAYVLRKPSNSADADPGRRGVSKNNCPLAFACVAASRTPYDGDKIRFDMDSFRKHAFMLKSDGSVKDIKDNLEPDADDDAFGRITPGKSIFPESSRGDTAKDYIVVTPNL